MEKFTFEGFKRPKVQLVDKDGNAWSILGRCQSASRGIWNDAQRKQFHDEAMSDDYDHLLRTVAKYFDLIDPDDDEFEGCDNMLDSFKANADARKHKDDTEVVEAYVYEKSMNLIVGNDGVMRVAYLILFKDYDDNCYQCLLFDKPDTYAMFEKHNVCMITIKSSPIKFPDTVFPVVDVKFKERK